MGTRAGDPPLFAHGDRVIVENAPVKFAAWRGHAGAVARFVTSPKIGQCIWITFDGYEDREATGPFVSGFLKREPVAGETKPPRKGVLNLRPTTDDRSEKEKQSQTVSLLESLGYTVMLVGQTAKPRPCRSCGTYNDVSGGGTTVGYPDLSVYHPTRWIGRNYGTVPCCLIEYKADQSAARGDEQKQFAKDGVSAFVWSDRTALVRLWQFERDWILNGPNPLLTAWLGAEGALFIPNQEEEK